MPPKKSNKNIHYRPDQPFQNKNISSNNRYPTLPITIPSEKPPLSILPFFQAQKQFQEQVSTFCLGKQFPNNIYLSKGVYKSQNQASNSTDSNFLQILRICQNEDNQMIDEAEQGTRQQKYRIVSDRIAQTYYPISKIMAVSSKFKQSLNISNSLNQIPSEMFFASSDSIHLYKYCPTQNNTGQLPILMELDQQQYRQSFILSEFSVPTSFDYCEESICPSTNFYSTHSNGTLVKWDVNVGQKVSQFLLSYLEVNDISMNRNIYGVICGDSKIVIGSQNCKIEEIKNVKEGKNVWKKQKFIKIKWVDQYHLAASCTSQDNWNGKGFNKDGKIYIFDVRYVANSGGIVTKIPQTDIFSVLQTGQPSQYNLNYLTQGFYSNMYHQNLNQFYVQELIHSVFTKDAKRPHKFQDQMYLDDKIWQQMAISPHWRLLSTENQLFCFNNKIQSQI